MLTLLLLVAVGLSLLSGNVWLVTVTFTALLIWLHPVLLVLAAAGGGVFLLIYYLRR